MEKAEVLKVIEKHLMNSVDGVSEGQVTENSKFTDYGANSLDIVEIVSATMRELKVKIPRTELNDIEDIGGLVEKFLSYDK